MEALVRLIPAPQPPYIRFGVTTLLVIAAFALRLGMGESTGRYGFIHFILPIVASSLLYGRGAGLFALVLCIALVAYVVPWQPDFGTNLSAFAVFVVVGLCLVLVADGLHRALQQARAAKSDSELLLQEMSHRVKNKFSMITSIIALQARNATPEVRDALQDIASRVKTIATVHDYLQRSRHDGLIEMSEYLPGLCKALHEALCGPRPISMSVQAVHADLAAEKALAVGVIANELVTNVLKYAFDEERPGRVQVELSRANGDFLLSVRDNGKGCSDDRRTGLGTRLVTVFAGQLGGTATWDANPGGGCNASVRFPA